MSTTTNTQETIAEALRTRAAAVGFTVNDTRADDGTYWIPSIGKWCSIAQIKEVVSDREANE
jgi:hypothetical protein